MRRRSFGNIDGKESQGNSAAVLIFNQLNELEAVIFANLPRRVGLGHDCIRVVVYRRMKDSLLIVGQRCVLRLVMIVRLRHCGNGTSMRRAWPESV